MPKPLVCGSIELKSSDVAFVYCEEAGVKNGIVRVYVEKWNEKEQCFYGTMVISGSTTTTQPVKFCRGQVVDVLKN